MEGLSIEEGIVLRLITEQYLGRSSKGYGYFVYDFTESKKQLCRMAAKKKAAGEAGPSEKFMDSTRQAEALRSLADRDIIEIDYVEERLLEDNSVDYCWHNGYEWSCALTLGAHFSPEVYSQERGHYYISTDGKTLNDINDKLVEKYDATLRRDFDHIIISCNGEEYAFLMPNFPTPSSIIDYATDKQRLNRLVTQEELVENNILPSNKKPLVKNAFRNSPTYTAVLRPFIRIEPRAITIKTTAKLTESEYRAIANK